MTDHALRALLLSLVVPIAVSAQPLEDQQSALAGLGALNVEVQMVGSATVEISLSEDALRRRVEQRLAESAVAVRSKDDPVPRGDPRLLVTVHAIRAAGGYAFMVSVQLTERVVSLRRYVELVLSGELPTTPAASVDPLALAPGVRWQVMAMGTASAERAAEFIPSATLDYVGRFAANYALANDP